LERKRLTLRSKDLEPLKANAQKEQGCSFLFSPMIIICIQSQAAQPADHRCPARVSGGASGLVIYYFPCMGLCGRRMGDVAVRAVWGTMFPGVGVAMMNVKKTWADTGAG